MQNTDCGLTCFFASVRHPLLLASARHTRLLASFVTVLLVQIAATPWTVADADAQSLAFARKGGASRDPSGTTLSVQLTNVRAGSLLVAFVKWEGTASAAVTLSDGTSTFTADAVNSAANSDLHGRFFYLPASSASGKVTYRATWSAARPHRRLLIYEYTYTGGTVSLDTSNRATATSGTLTSGAVTTTGSEGVVFGAYGEYSATTTTNERIGAAVADQVVRSRYASMWSKEVTSPFTGAATASGNSSTWIGSVIAFTRTDAAGPVITPPTVSLTAPVSGATFTAPASVVMTALAGDSDGTVAKVDFYAGATLVGTDTTSPYAYTWSGATAGSYAIKAIATDNSGAATTSAPINVIVTVSGNVAPTVSLTSPANGASFVAPATVTFAATATDSDGTVQKVEFYVGATRVATDTTSPFSATWSAPVGSHSASAVATDDLGAVTVSAWRDFTVTATAVLGTAIFTPASPGDQVDYYMFEVFAAGADPNVAAPIATQNIGLPTVVNGECSADVRATILGLAPGNYIATVASMGSNGKLLSNAFTFTR